ncbi:MAG: DUF1080 domain-containing protein [Pirellulales bacterium]|nr:DUF1080 domain-containing protein [Pirellulales bacterium]
MDCRLQMRTVVLDSQTKTARSQLAAHFPLLQRSLRFGPPLSPWLAKFYRGLAVACCGLLGVMILTATVSGEESAAVQSADSGYAQDLFNGRDLTGWQVTGCTAVVEDGAILLKEGNGFVRSDLQYEDFVLELDYKPLAKEFYDSGIYIRAPFPAKNPKRAWPDQYQINLKTGDEGNLLGIDGATTKGLIKPGEWNHLKIMVKGESAALEVNGQPAWKATGLKIPRGYIGLQAEVPNGGQFLFKNIKLTELGFESIFNGQDLSQWVGDTTGYTVRDGKIVCDPGKGGNLYTKDEYQDFVLRFDFWLSPGANNGLGIRAPLSGDSAYTGMELQILDDSHPQYQGIKDWQSHGSVYGVAAAKRGALRPAGEWNTQEVRVQGRDITVTLNGTVINQVNLDEVAPNGKTIDGNAHPGLQNKQGHIGFLGHGAHVEFRNLRVKPLTNPAKSIQP